MSDASAGEAADHGQFTITMSNKSDTDTIIAYSVSGEATAGNDYSPLSGAVTIAAGQTSATIDVNVLDDSLLEDSETVTVTLDSISAGDAEISVGAAKMASITLSDDDTGLVSISASDALAAEPNDDGEFTVSLSKLSDSATTITYTIAGDASSGVDFTPLTGMITIAAFTSSGTIDLEVLNDGILEDAESVIVTLTGIATGDVNYSIDATKDQATIEIADTDTALVSIDATDAWASEPSDHGAFTFTMSAAADSATTIHYSVGGTASVGADYVGLSGSVTIAAGDTTAIVDVTVLDQALLEDSETVIVTLDSVSGDDDISIQTGAHIAAVTIADDDTAKVSIAATDSTGEEPGNNGQFTVTMTGTSDKATVINYTVNGTANRVEDYVTLSNSVTIAAGDSSATIDVSVINDAIVEPTEWVTITLLNTNDSDVTVDTTSDSATVLIGDDDGAVASIVAIDADAGEPSNPGQFTLTLSQPSATDTVVNFSVTGNATAGTDYVTLPSSVTILAGETEALIDVNVLDQSLLEDNENVIVTLTGTDNGLISVSVIDNTATVTITDDDLATVSISANDDAAAEPGNDGQFTVTMSQASDKDTIVNLSIAGSADSADDYIAIPSSVTIAAGQTTAIIDVSAVNDTILEESETIVVTLTGTDDLDVTINPGAASDIVTLDDDDDAVISIAANDADAGEASNHGQFTVSMTNAADQNTVITYGVAGNAGAGSDYQSLTGTVTISAGETAATIDVTVIDNDILEDNETVVVTLGSITSGDAQATLSTTNFAAAVTITDDELATISITANDASASEPSDQGQFTVAMTHASDKDTEINYLVTGTANNGSDYTALSGTVTIVAGEKSATIDVSVIDSDLLEDSETVIVTLDSTSDTDIGIPPAGNSATVTIVDEDKATVSIAATDADAGETSNHGEFTITLSDASDKDTIINYLVTGSAGAGSDYFSIGSSVTIAAGATSATIDISVLDNDILEETENVIVTLLGTDDPDITVAPTGNTATVTITDDEVALLSIVANDATASEPTDHGQFTVSLTKAADQDTVVSYLVTGTADAGTDFVALTGNITIEAGNSDATIDLSVVDDDLLEDAENITLTLSTIDSGDSNIAFDNSAKLASVTIADEDKATVSITANDATAAEPGDHGQFTVTMSQASDKNTLINFNVTGTAGASTDFLSFGSSVTILAGQTSAVIDVTVIDNDLLEESESVIVTLTGTSDSDVTLDNAVKSSMVTIADNETSTVSITAIDTAAGEPSNDGQFEVTMSTASSTDTVLNLLITGTAGSGSDYVAIPATVTIGAGDTTATIDVTVIDNDVLEESETVIVTVTNVNSGDSDITIDTGANSATVTISDE